MRLGAPWNWYRLDSAHSLDLLKTFAQRTELQIEAAIDHFVKNKKKDFVVLSEEDRIGQTVTHYDGLDDMSWDIEELFTSHFPNLQRKSAFLTLYAFLEHEMEKLAVKLKDESLLTARLEDIAGKGIHRSFSYMQLIVNLKIGKSDISWNKISEINKLRNLIIHNNGQLSTDEKTRSSQEKFAARLKGHLNVKDDELVLGATFLQYVLDKFDKLFQYIDVAIQAKFASKKSRKSPLSKRKDKTGKKKPATKPKK